MAERPEPWARREGDFLLLWAGWDPGRDHHWFRARKGDLDEARVSAPIGRDVVNAIEDPLVEMSGGAIWEKLPGAAEVVGDQINGTTVAYPTALLRRVCVVNDLIGERPYLVGSSVEKGPNTPFAIFDAQLNGHRLILGTAGFLLQGRPVLYDRETESLWVEDGDAMRAVSGKNKGCSLPLVSRMTPTRWDAWRARNPQSRLLVGARPRQYQVPPK
jgi:hypothetical protein